MNQQRVSNSLTGSVNGRLGKVEGRLDTVENAMAETGPKVDDLHGWCRQLDQRVTDLEGD